MVVGERCEVRHVCVTSAKKVGRAGLEGGGFSSEEGDHLIGYEYQARVAFEQCGSEPMARASVATRGPYKTRIATRRSDRGRV